MRKLLVAVHLFGFIACMFSAFVNKLYGTPENATLWFLFAVSWLVLLGLRLKAKI